MSKYLFENDYSADFIRWIKKVEEKDIHLNRYSYDRYGSNPNELELFQQEIIDNKDSALAYFFTLDFSYKPYLMQKIIIENEDSKYAYMFAKNIKNADIEALQKIVVRSEKIRYICKFACFVRGADIKNMERIIYESGKVKYAHMFIKYVKKADVEKFKPIILESKKPRYLFELAKHISNPEEISKIEDLIIDARSFTYMRLMAEKIKGADIDKLEQAILNTKNMDEAVKFAKSVKKSKMKRFFLVL